MKTNKELTIIKEINPVLANASTLQIKSQEDMAPATELLSQINKYADAMKKDRLKLTAPLEESLKLIRAKYSPTEKLLKDAVDTIKEKMGGFQTAQLKIQREEEAKIASKLESGYIKVDTAIKKMGEVEVVEKKVQTIEGAVSFREDPDFELMDLSLVPVDYVEANMTKIRTAMKAGIQIAGCRYFTKQTIVNRRQ